MANVVVQVQDAYGNAVAQSDTDITLTLNGSELYAGTNPLLTDASGKATFSDVIIQQAGTGLTFDAAGGSLTGATSNAFNITALAAVGVGVETAADGSGAGVPSQSISAGSSLQVYAITRDIYGNFVANVAATAWTLENRTGYVVSGDLVPAGDSKSALFTGHGAGTATIRATSGALTYYDSGVLTVVPAAFVKLQILLPGEAAAPGTPSGKTGTPTARQAGTAFNVTVNAVDGNWNVLNTVTDLVEITSSDSGATLPVNAALVAGTKIFSVTLNTIGSQTVTASDLTNPCRSLPAGVSSQVTVIAGPANKLAYTSVPTTGTAGVAFSVTVQSQDLAGNPANVTSATAISLDAETGGGTLSGTTHRDDSLWQRQRHDHGHRLLDGRHDDAHGLANVGHGLVARDERPHRLLGRRGREAGLHGGAGHRNRGDAIQRDGAVAGCLRQSGEPDGRHDDHAEHSDRRRDAQRSPHGRHPGERQQRDDLDAGLFPGGHDDADGVAYVWAARH